MLLTFIFYFQTLNTTKSSWDLYGREARESIDLQIAELIAVLEVIGAENKKQVTQVVAEVKNKLGTVKLLLKQDIDILQEAVAGIDFGLNKIPKTKLFVDILNDFSESLCDTAVGVKNIKPTKNPIKFEFDVEVAEKLNKHSKLTANMSNAEPKIVTGLRA